MKQKGFAQIFILVIMALFALVALFLYMDVTSVGCQSNFRRLTTTIICEDTIPLPSLTNEKQTTKPFFPQVSATEEAVLKNMSIDDLRWVTYMNTDLGIKLSYPDNFLTITEEGKAPDGSFDARALFFKKLNPLSSVVNIEKYNTTKNLADWWKDASTNHVKVIVTPTVFKNTNALYLKINDVVQVPMDSYVVKRGDSVISIDFVTTYIVDVQSGGDPKQALGYEQANSDFEKSLVKQIIDKILNSIEFI